VDAVRLPEVPVTLRVEVPAAAEADAATVSVLAPDADSAPNETDTPVGKPDAVRLTLPVKPPSDTTETKVFIEPPCVRLSVDAAAERLNDGAATTVTAIAVVFARVPEVPVIVAVAVPGAADELAAITRLFCANDAVTPEGRPETFRATIPVKPFCGVTAIVLETAPPCVTVTAAGAALRLNVDAAVTVRLRTAVFNWLPEVPDMVTAVVPIAAAPVAVRVIELVPATVPRVIDAPTPAGRPDTVNPTVPAKPPTADTAIVAFAEVPCAMPTAVGETEIVKPDTGVTVTAITTASVRLPDLPVMVTEAVPGTAALAAEKVTVLGPLAAGLNAAVTPAGNPDALRTTLPVKPF
jgi:hypothetical protein